MSEMMNTCRHELNIWGECQMSLFKGYCTLAPYVRDMSYRPCALLMSGYETLLWYIVMAVLTRHLNVFEQCDYYNNEVTVQHATVMRPKGQGRV
jgi:hypothetical protein